MDIIIICLFYAVLIRVLIDGIPVTADLNDYWYLFRESDNDNINSAELLEGNFGTVPSSVPLIMKKLLQKIENNMTQFSKLSSSEISDDCIHLAKSVSPTVFEQDGARRILLEYPSLRGVGQKMTNWEARLVLSVNENYLQENECDQVVKVYQTTRWDAKLLKSIPLKKYSLPFVEVNITDVAKRHSKNRLHFVVNIEDSTSYSSDDINLKNFSNFFFCSLPDASKIFTLDRIEQTPVLLLVSQGLAGNLSQTVINRKKRENSDVVNSYQTQSEVIPENNENCQLVEWTKTTEELEWEWLIYPERIPINLCTGVCPSTQVVDNYYNSSNHAVVRALYSIKEDLAFESHFPAPCCVPRSFRPISMLIAKSSSIISLEIINNLSASKCGCL